MIIFLVLASMVFAGNYSAITRQTSFSGVISNENMSVRVENTQPIHGFVLKTSSNQAYLGVIPYNFSETPNSTSNETTPPSGGGGSGSTDDDNVIDDVTEQAGDDTKQGAAAELFKQLLGAFTEEYWLQNRSKIIGLGTITFVALAGILLLVFGRKKKHEEE